MLQPSLGIEQQPVVGLADEARKIAADLDGPTQGLFLAVAEVAVARWKRGQKLVVDLGDLFDADCERAGRI